MFHSLKSFLQRSPRGAALLGCCAWLALATLLGGCGSNQADSDYELYYFLQDDSAGSLTPYGNNLPAGHYVTARDGARLYYEVYGSGKPLLILHGGGVGTPYEMGRLIDTLRPDFKLYVLSTRGHGRSEIGTEPLSLKQRAADILSLLQQEGVESTAVLGFSDGAYSAYALASLYPGQVERLVAIGAGTLKKGFFPDHLDLDALKKADPRFMAQMERLWPQPERMARFFNDYMAFWHGLSVPAQFFARINAPALLIAGDEDDHAPLATVYEAFEALPMSRLMIVPKAWHTAFLDQPSLVSAAAGDFLRAENPAGSRKAAIPN
ncbi:MAG: alpha/beta fold hydrolase [Succinivibrio sp.]|nr:alpha/beta fold hydrolase [Succinivibrio sp.]